MARKTRLFLEDTPQHVVIRGINDKVIFLDEDDYQAFLAILKALVVNIEIELHTYVLMPSYFQFLATPLYENSLSKFMQSLGRRYVGYFNKKYERRGTLWEGRYKSSLVESKTYLYEVMRFIESKPKKSKSYPYSSIHKNIFSKDDAIITPREEYSCSDYTAFFDTKRDKESLSFVASSLEKQTVTGSFEFSKRVEEELGVTVVPKKRGRPQKNQNIQRKKMYNNLVIINKRKHQNLKLLPLDNLSFARELKYIPSVISESAYIAQDYPLVISGGEIPSLITLVALDGDNLSISEDGKWYGKHIPSYLQKFPFTLGTRDEHPEEGIIMIDEDSSFVSTTKGEALFTPEGKRTEKMEKVVELLLTYEAQRQATQKIIELISASNILDSAEISVGKGEEKKVLVKGFKVVNQEKLNALSPELTEDWEEMGVYTLINNHIHSLDNIKNLFSLASKQQV